MKLTCKKHVAKLGNTNHEDFALNRVY